MESADVQEVVLAAACQYAFDRFPYEDGAERSYGSFHCMPRENSADASAACARTRQLALREGDLVAANSNAQPRIQPKSPDVLEEGMTFNINPPHILTVTGGMRHCDVVAVISDGAAVLTEF